MSAAHPHHRHPVGLWWIAVSYAFYTFGFGTVNSLLVLYAIRYLHVPAHYAYGLFGAFNALIFTLPIFCGYFISRIGYQRSANFGAIFTVIGILILMFRTKMTLILGLTFFAAGYGFNAPAIFCLAGFLYSAEDHRRESGLTSFYVVMNLGFLISIFSGGWFARYLGYQTTFLIAAVTVTLMCVSLLWGSRYIHYVSASPVERVMTSFVKRIGLYLVVTIAIGILGFWVLNHYVLTDWVASAIAVLAIILLVIIAFKQRAQRGRKVMMFIILCITALVFFVVYMMEPSVVTVFIANNVDRSIGHITIPASSFYSLDSFFVILLGLVLRKVWCVLKSHRRMPTKLTSFGVGLCTVGIGMLLLMLGTMLHNPHTLLTNMLWVVVAYACFGLAELLIIPMGLSMVGELAPPHLEGLFMGVFNFSVGYGAIIAGLIGIASTSPHAGLAAANHTYTHSFGLIGLVGVVAGVIALSIVPAAKKFNLLSAAKH